MLKLFPADLDEQIGFTDLFHHLLNQCSFEIGKNFIISEGISDDFEEVSHRLLQLQEWNKAIEQNPFNFRYDIHIIKEKLNVLKVEDAVLSLSECVQLLKVGLQIEQIVSFLNNHKEFAPNLALMGIGLQSPKDFNKSIQKIIDLNHLSILDNATEKLFEIRTKIKKTHRELDRVFAKALSQYEDFLGESREGVKDGRRVLVVQSSYVRQVPGMSMGISGNGFLHYIIPASLLEHYNLLSLLAAEEEREIYLILKNLTAYLSQYYESILEWIDFVAFIDGLKARYSFSKHIEGKMPYLSQSPKMTLSDAQNPSLVLMKHRGLIDKVIPFSAAFTPEKRLMLISGPNAGGKSVTLKSLGLLQMILQAGCFVPVGEQSVMTVFKLIMGDIGDRQSVENSLSTYSAHLTAMKYFLEHADRNTLIMIDEAGTGTDPDFGGVIAEVILEKLLDRGVWGCVTTHYNNLKVFGSRHDAVFNAAMLFDKNTLQPLFELQVGNAGSSYAIETLQRIYPNTEIINEIQSKLDKSKKQLSITLTEIQNEKHFVKGLRKSLQQHEKEVQELKFKYEKLKNDLSAQKQKLEKHYKEKALEAFNDANRQIEQYIREAKGAASKEEIKSIRKEVDSNRNKLVKDIVQTDAKEVKPVSRKIATVGSTVRWGEGEELGKVMEMDKKYAIVQFGHFNTKIPVNQLVVEEDYEEPKQPKRKAGTHTQNLIVEKSQFVSELDIRGKFKEEASHLIEEFIDKALMLSMDKVRIIHGKGNGILRNLVKSILKENSIKKHYHEPYEMGGDGVTIIEF